MIGQRCRIALFNRDRIGPIPSRVTGGRGYGPESICEDLA